MKQSNKNIPRLISGALNSNINRSSVPQAQQLPQIINPIRPMAQPQIQQGPQLLLQPTNTISILGQVFQKTHVYIVGIILVIIIGYMVWTWYQKRSNDDDDDEDDELEDDDEISHARQMQYMPRMVPQNMYESRPLNETHRPYSNEIGYTVPSKFLKNGNVGTGVPNKPPGHNGTRPTEIPQYQGRAQTSQQNHTGNFQFPGPQSTYPRGGIAAAKQLEALHERHPQQHQIQRPPLNNQQLGAQMTKVVQQDIDV